MIQRLIANKKPLIIIFSLVILAFRLKDFLGIEDHYTWDGPGHKVLLQIFIQLSSEFLAEGYVEDWFGGFPAFRFYPPFFAFIGSIPYFAGFEIDSSFRISILIALFVYVFGYTYFVSYFLSSILSFSTLFFYLSFQGDPTLGVSLPGVYGGNFPSLLGTGLVYISIGSILRSNCFSNKIELKYLLLALASISLLGYSHYLSFIFCYMIIFLYILFQIKKIVQMQPQKRWILLTLFFLPIFVALPSLYGPIFNSSDSSGETLFSPYLFFETLIGFNHSSYNLTEILVQPLRIIPLFFIFGIILFKKKNSTELFLISSMVLLFFLCQDDSISRIFHFTKIHFYRAWDLFLGFYFLIGVLGLSRILAEFKMETSIYAVSIISLLFLGYRYQSDPVDYFIRDSFDRAMEKLKLQSSDHILSEATTSYPWNKSPHKNLSWIQERGIRSQNGLMLESSWTTFVDRLYLPIQNENDFVWGFQDPRRIYNLVKPSEELTYRYLQERKISHILTKTNSFYQNFSFLNQIAILNKDSMNQISNKNQNESLQNKQMLNEDTNQNNQNLIKIITVPLQWKNSINQNSPNTKLNNNIPIDKNSSNTKLNNNKTINENSPNTIEKRIANDGNNSNDRNKPIGLVDLNRTLGYNDSLNPQEFFLQSFLLMQDSNFQDSNFVDLNPVWNEMQNENYQHVVSSILIYNPENRSVVETIPIAQWKQNRKIHNQSLKNLTSDRQKDGNSVDLDSKCNSVVFNQSYFPEIKIKNDSSIIQPIKLYRTQFNQTLACLSPDQINPIHADLLYLPTLLGRIKFFGMILTFLFWLVSGFLVYKKTRALGKL